MFLFALIIGNAASGYLADILNITSANFIWQVGIAAAAILMFAYQFFHKRAVKRIASELGLSPDAFEPRPSSQK
jgi:hypothetical protein